MGTYVVIHGAGDTGATWQLVADELRARGHDVVTPDLPCEDDSAGLSEYADTVVEAIAGRTGLVLVAHSLGGFTAPLVYTRLDAELIVLVAGMIPSPGQTASQWWSIDGFKQASQALNLEDDSPTAVFLHDVAPDLAAEALAQGRDQSGTPMTEPWPLDRWPDVPTRYLLCREDRVFPADWLREVVRERLGIEPDEIDGGHCPYLSRPKELAERLESYRTGSSVSS